MLGNNMLDELELKRINPEALFGETEVIDGFPRLDWDCIETWIDANVASEHVFEAWDEVTLCWLEKLRLHLGDNYEVYVSDSVHLLCALEESQANGLIWFTEDVRERVHDYLSELDLGRLETKECILAFADRDAYTSYICFFYDAGEYGTSGGVQIRAGYDHVVLAPGTGRSLESVIAHELCHSVLSERDLPTWIEEGLAQVMEELILRQPGLVLDRDARRKHVRYWRTHGLEKFWSGDGFSLNTEGQSLSYELAHVLVQNLAADHGKSFFEFVREAKHDDAGEAAARRYLRCRLSDCVSQFLGHGSWGPRPPTPEKYR